MKQSRVKVLFFILKTKLLKNGNAPIVMRITVNQTKDEVRIGRSINPRKWNNRLERATGKDEISRELNIYLDGLFARVTQIHRKLEEEDCAYNPAMILNLLFENKDDHFLLKQFHKHNKRYRELAGIEFNEKTVQRWERTEKYLSDFISEKYKLEDISLVRIDRDFIVDFEHFLKVNKGNGKNTSSKYLENLKKIIKAAHDNNIIKINPFNGVKLGKVKAKRIPLNEMELKQIMNTTIDIDRLDIVRDCFVFCCFTGLSFTDAFALKADNIHMDQYGQYWIYVNRQKTDNLSRIPLLDIPKSIIKKYQNHYKCGFRNTLLPLPSNQRYNSYLKELATICHINKNLTSHVARHTFATLALSNHVSLEVVSKMLGHEDIRTTTIYAHILDSTISNQMQGMKKKFLI